MNRREAVKNIKGKYSKLFVLSRFARRVLPKPVYFDKMRVLSMSWNWIPKLDPSLAIFLLSILLFYGTATL